MGELVTMNKETVIDFIRKRGHVNRNDLKQRYALSDTAVNELIEGLEENGHIEPAWVLGSMWDGINS